VLRNKPTTIAMSKVRE